MSDQAEKKFQTNADILREMQVRIHAVLMDGGKNIGGDRGVQMLCDVCSTFARLEIAAQLDELKRKLTIKSEAIVDLIVSVQDEISKRGTS